MRNLLILVLIAFSTSLFFSSFKKINNIKVEKKSTRDSALATALKQLHISEEFINKKLVVYKQLPYEVNKAVIVIPQYDTTETKGKIEEYNATYHAHILIVDIHTFTILDKYVEKSAWISDAIFIEELIIDTAPYRLNNNSRAFGIRIKYRSTSRSYPYYVTDFSLYITTKNSLKELLHNYEIFKYEGEWDGNCKGEFKEKECVFTMDKQKTYGYYNLIVKQKTTNYQKIEKNGDCKEKKTISEKIKILKYKNSIYK